MQPDNLWFLTKPLQGSSTDMYIARANPEMKNALVDSGMATRSAN